MNLSNLIKLNNPGYILFFAVFIGITAPSLWTDGMFMDGTIYASISRNLAEDSGSFWQLHFSDTLMSQFNGHPPLAFYLNSVLFRLFGDAIFVERLYSFLTGLIAIVLIIKIQQNFNEEKSQNITIITLFIWLSFPLVIWTYSNNILENTMTVFILLSTYFIIKSFKKHRLFMLFSAGIFLFAAFMSKGFPALFVWSVIFFYQVIFKRINSLRMLIDTSLLVFFTVLPLFLIFILSPEAKENLSQYFNEQVVRSIESIKTVDSRFFIIGSMLKEIIIPLVFFSVLVITSKLKKIKLKIQKTDLKKSIFFFLIALSGILPIMISLKQRNFYIIPSLPFLAMSFAYLTNNVIDVFPNFRYFFKKKIVLPLSYTLLIVSITIIFIFAGKPGRDFDTLHDVYKVIKIVPADKNILICKEMYSNWSLHAYMQRLGKISISDKAESNCLMTEGNCKKDTLYVKIDLGLKKFSLYKKKTQ